MESLRMRAAWSKELVVPEVKYEVKEEEDSAISCCSVNSKEIQSAFCQLYLLLMGLGTKLSVSNTKENLTTSWSLPV